MNLKNSKILVTGAGGFIGSHLTEALVERGCNVRALVHYNSRGSWGLLDLLPKSIQREIEIVQGDVRDPFSSAKAASACGTIFHLAALIAIPYSYIAPAEYVATNVIGTLNMLEAARNSGAVRFIHTSTSEVYGTARYVPIDENHPLQGQSPYSASKISADKIAESYYRSFELPVVTVRPFNAFGPRQSARAIIPTVISQALYRDKIEVGSLDPVRDLTFVKDTVQGFIKAAEADNTVGETINIGMGHGYSIGELITSIKKLLNKADLPVIQDNKRMRPSKSEVMQLICQNQKARESFGWSPVFTLEEGLREVIAFIQSHPDLYRPEIYTV